MNSLAQTIDQALFNIGHGPRDVLFETLEAFENLALPDEERISAIATAMAASALHYHDWHVEKFLDAVQTWAVESSCTQSPTPPRIGALPEPDSITDGAEILNSGVEALLEALDGAQVALQDRVVAELTIYTRLLGQHDVRTILLAVSTVAGMTALPDFRPGDLVSVPLREPVLTSRSIDLASTPARGIA